MCMEDSTPIGRNIERRCILLSGRGWLYLVQWRLQGRTLVASIAGEFDLNIADRVRGALDTAIDANPEVRRMIVDMGSVSFIDSSGAGVLFGRHKRLAARGGGLVIANPSLQVRRALDLLGAGQLMQVFDTVERALSGLGEVSTWKGR